MKLLGDIHERNAWFRPHSPAIVFEDQTRSYAEYWERINRIADGLYRLGVRHQDRVGLLSMNRVEYLEVYGACERAGFIISTVNFRLSATEMAFILSDSAPHTLIFEDQYTALLDGLRPALGVKRYVCLGNAPDWADSFEVLVEGGLPDGPPCRAAPDDGALIMYTSGTTGRPKGVFCLQRGEMGWADQMAGLIGVRGDTRQLLMMPFFHRGARSQYVASFLRGGAVHIHRKFDPPHIVDTMEQRRITHTHMAPTMLQDVLNVPGIEQRDLSSVEIILYSAAPMPVPLLKRGLTLLGNVFANGYGGTECNATYLAPHQHHIDGSPEQVKRLASVGQAAVDVDLRIVDEDDNPCAVGVPGEVAYRSHTILGGYWNNGPASVDALRNGWYHSGDVGYLDAEGYLFLVDRKKDMIISGGENIYCREVEDAVERHPAVVEVAVIGVPDPKWGETVCAIVVLRRGEEMTADQLIQHARGQIAHYKAPKIVVFLEELPRLQSGKVSKVILRERFGAGAVAKPESSQGADHV
ncbi:MAG: hypothetical protein QOF70_7382 [Acetobacteraceae bacterium]|jgi:acyl-CoA synthetase (AMP-forming)/AMP-acid ligase II|nr:hypothetical protein [Acetobacteraceae bacterium]